MRTPFLYLGNDLTDFAEIWYAGEQLARQLTQTKGGVFCTCVSLFSISGATGNIVLDFAMWVEGLTSYACFTKPCMVYQYLHVPSLGFHGSILLKYGLLFDPLTMSLTHL